MIRDWPQKLTFTGLGATLILWTSGTRLMESWEPTCSGICDETPNHDRWQWMQGVLEARYPLAIAIGITVLGAYHWFTRRNSN